MESRRKDLDWEHLDFSYRKTDWSYSSSWKDGVWDAGGLTADHSVRLSESAGILHYCQECFEGLKAYSTESGQIVCFRPDLNAERMITSAQRLEMPPLPKDRFLSAVDEVIAANAEWVPPAGSGAALYVRPFMFATGEVLGVAPASAYEFRIFVAPVGPYFKAGVKPIRLCVSHFDRAAPRGTGGIKAGLNYGMSVKPTMDAHRAGFDENLYLDAQSRTYVEESGGANVLFVDRNGGLIGPQSPTNSILDSITRRSLVQVAQDLGMRVEERPVAWDEVASGAFTECGLCGTAAVISPVGEIHHDGQPVVFPCGHTEMGPVMKRLRETLIGIQTGSVPDQHGWVHVIC